MKSYDEEANNSASVELQNDLNPKRTCTHRAFRMVKVLAMTSALGMGIGQFIGFFFGYVDPIQYILRIYVMAFCVVMILNELEVAKFLYDSAFLNNWISRGIIYSFVGIIGVSENHMEGVEGITKAAATFTEVVAYGMVLIGVVYFAMGALCCQIVYGRTRKDFEERSQWASRKKKEKGMR